MDTERLTKLLEPRKKNSTLMRVSPRFKKLVDRKKEQLKEKMGQRVSSAKVTELLAIEINVIVNEDKDKEEWNFSLF